MQAFTTSEYIDHQLRNAARAMTHALDLAEAMAGHDGLASDLYAIRLAITQTSDRLSRRHYRAPGQLALPIH